jgi:hypothetical protein
MARRKKIAVMARPQVMGIPWRDDCAAWLGGVATRSPSQGIIACAGPGADTRAVF